VIGQRNFQINWKGTDKWARCARNKGELMTCDECQHYHQECDRLNDILARLFENSCYGCSCLAECEKDGLAWDAYNIGCVARIDCLGAK